MTASYYKTLVTGKGTSGSWQCRGVQLGGQVGEVKAKAALKDCQSADLIVVVKRTNQPFFENVKRSKKPWVWDLVDFYPQPNNWPKEKAVKWVRQQINKYKPSGIIWPTARMKIDIGLGGEVIYHHGRIGQINPIREKIQVIGYEGSERYLGKWRKILETECQKRGWAFKVNVPLNHLDVVVAFRDDPFNGYCEQKWKSNVKLANAHITGTPFIGWPESGYSETWSGKELWAMGKDSISFCFDKLEPYEERLNIHRTFLSKAMTLDQVGNQLKEYLDEVYRA